MHDAEIQLRMGDIAQRMSLFGIKPFIDEVGCAGQALHGLQAVGGFDPEIQRQHVVIVIPEICNRRAGGRSARHALFFTEHTQIPVLALRVIEFEEGIFNGSAKPGLPLHAEDQDGADQIFSGVLACSGGERGIGIVVPADVNVKQAGVRIGRGQQPLGHGGMQPVAHRAAQAHFLQNGKGHKGRPSLQKSDKSHALLAHDGLQSCPLYVTLFSEIFPVLEYEKEDQIQ